MARAVLHSAACCCSAHNALRVEGHIRALLVVYSRYGVAVSCLSLPRLWAKGKWRAYRSRASGSGQISQIGGAFSHLRTFCAYLSRSLCASTFTAGNLTMGLALRFASNGAVGRAHLRADRASALRSRRDEYKPRASGQSRLEQTNKQHRAYQPLSKATTGSKRISESEKIISDVTSSARDRRLRRHQRQNRRISNGARQKKKKKATVSFFFLLARYVHLQKNGAAGITTRCCRTLLRYARTVLRPPTLRTAFELDGRGCSVRLPVCRCADWDNAGCGVSRTGSQPDHFWWVDLLPLHAVFVR